MCSSSRKPLTLQAASLTSRQSCCVAANAVFAARCAISGSQRTSARHRPATYRLRFAVLSSESSSPSNSQNERWIKLYNASNFFAPYNVPTEDLPEIASLVRDFDRVIVENHPSLTSPSIASFAQQINGRLEVAMGLETVDSTVLRMLNKQVEVEDVRAATLKLIAMQVDVRLFVLLRPPCQSESAAIESCLASIEAAREWGARHVSIIPVRAGNGMMEHLQASGDFEPPLASSLEFVLRESIARSSLVVTADTWDWSQLRGLCENCIDIRRTAIQRSNLTQVAAPVTQCVCCG